MNILIYALSRCLVREIGEQICLNQCCRYYNRDVTTMVLQKVTEPITPGGTAGQGPSRAEGQVCVGATCVEREGRLLLQIKELG